ncbi:MAG TPA: AAA family ATPase [Intrasporangium sp.]|uniref:helix-turn-helix transcriptional regulator n=1 Tax=Intrasporangium sp. TaxID=1925024 RepID=UPI002B496D1C|nr:AAA family ATPase [Intrasporangium sp.]HKX67628.1 AAA family ATPase [Intrasporangium sp.]
MDARAALVGRDAERAALDEAVRRSAAGSPSAVLVSGESGIGKTRLVTEVTAGFEREGGRAFWGRCLRFGAAESPYHPIGQIVSHWFRQASAAERERVLADVDPEGLGAISPLVARSHGEPDPAELMRLVTTVLDRISAEAPTAVVVDDLQWADTTSLDLIAYLMTGFGPGQRLCVLATYRDTDLGEGHRLHGWLADMRRFPAVQFLPLGRLGLQDTEELVAQLRGNERAVARGAAVFEGSGGNPYLAELLTGVPEGESAARATTLREVLLASWHRLAKASRDLMQLLAVGGRPVPVAVLGRLAASRGLTAQDVRDGVAESGATGITILNEQGELWFRHPLLAEVILTTLLPEELLGIHREFALVWEEVANQPLVARAAHLALHYEGAGRVDDAFEWSLRASDTARELFAYAEESQHLHRASLLWERLSATLRGSDHEWALLLGRASDSAFRAGDFTLALELRERALQRVDRVGHPLDAAHLYTHLGLYKDNCGLTEVSEPEPDHLAVTEPFPESPERAIALAWTAFANLWGGRHAAAVQDADEAVRISRRAGSDEALAWALGVKSQTRWSTTAGLRDAEEAVVHARAAGDQILRGHTAVFVSNCLAGLGRVAEATDVAAGLVHELMSTRSFYEAVEVIPGVAVGLLDLGRWDELRSLLHNALSRRVQGAWGAEIRFLAADLAVRTGNLQAAQLHQTRARELLPGRRLVGGIQPVVEARIAWAAGDLARSLEILEQALHAHVDVDPADAAEGLVWAARTAADLGERPGERDAAVRWLDRIEDALGVTSEWFGATTSTDAIHPAWGRLYAAESHRCRADRQAQPQLWDDAVRATDEAGLVWECALASYRLAQSQLATGGSRARASAALRDAARIASHLGATPILRDAEALAGQAHIPLTEPVPADHEGSVPAELARLTRREREVLHHLVAGRTYAEIARELFISEKTVSVHVSNVLHKTGTATRIEVAHLARRLDFE